jgi:hypothetical protein
MNGRLVDAWQYAWTDVWLELEGCSDAPSDLFMQLYPELARALQVFPEPTTYDSAANDPRTARRAFEALESSQIRSDGALVRFYEEAYCLIEELGRPPVTEAYVVLMRSYLERYNLRFQLLPPFQLAPHIQGVFCAFFGELKKFCGSTPHLTNLMSEFEQSIEALSRSHQEHDIKACILRACNEAEAIAKAFPGVKSQTLGDLCKEAKVWPHKTIEKSLSSLYGFCSDYPNIRHSGNADGKLREVNVKDSVLIAILFITFSGYFAGNLDFEEILGSRTKK